MTSADFHAKISDTTRARVVTNACPVGSLPARAEGSGVLRSRLLAEPQTCSTSASLATQRIAGIDQLRVVAAIGIVWFHMEGAPFRQIGYAGLPVFLLIFFSLITRDFGTTTTHFVRRRWDRLLKPWLFWSALYGVCRLIKDIHMVDTAELWGMLSIETLFAGASIHLWYLPYAFLSGLLAFTINRRTREVDHVVAVATAAIAGMLTLAVCTMGMTNHRMPQPLPQWEFGLAAIPLGLAIGRCLMIPSQNLRKTLLAGIALVVLVESQVLQALDVGATATPYGIGTMLVCIAYCIEIKGNAFVLSLAPLTFGIYLIHPLVIYGLQHTLPLTGHYGLFILLAVSTSALITLILMRTPVRRFL